MKRLFVRQAEAMQMTGYKRSKISEVFDEIRYHNQKYRSVRLKDVVFIEDFADYIGVTPEIIEKCFEKEAIQDNYVTQNRQLLTSVADQLEQTAKMVRERLNEVP